MFTRTRIYSFSVNFLSLGLGSVLRGVEGLVFFLSLAFSNLTRLECLSCIFSSIVHLFSRDIVSRGMTCPTCVSQGLGRLLFAPDETCLLGFLYRLHFLDLDIRFYLLFIYVFCTLGLFWECPFGEQIMTHI